MKFCPPSDWNYILIFVFTRHKVNERLIFTYIYSLIEKLSEKFFEYLNFLCLFLYFFKIIIFIPFINIIITIIK